MTTTSNEREPRRVGRASGRSRGSAAGSRASLLPHRRRALATAAALTALALPLAACGSSSDDEGGSGAAASSTIAAAGTVTNAAGASDRAALQDCLREQGVELPTPPAGAGRPPQGDGPPQGAATTPDGPPQGDGAPGDSQGGPPSGGRGGGFFGRDLSAAERRRMEAAFETCGARFGGGVGGPGGGVPGGRGGRPDAAALARFVACVRRNGYDLPDPNISGDGPVFDDSAVDRDDPAFVRASRACQRYLAPSS